jgi:hypothetical protein
LCGKMGGLKPKKILEKKSQKNKELKIKKRKEN